MPLNDSPAPDASSRKNGDDTELRDKELKQLKELKNGSAKGKAQLNPAAEPKPVSKSAAASASKNRSKKVGSSSPLTQHLLSALALVVAMAYCLTSRPTPPVASRLLKPPRVDPVQAPVAQDGTDQSWVRDECQSWAEDGECENNPALMKERCPGKCKGKPAKAAKATAKNPAEDEGPPDKSVHCGVWAAQGECEKNAAFMLGECAASCRGVVSKSTSVDMNQDCTPWVADGECYRNPAFMLQQCKASCEEFASNNQGILQDTSDSCVNFALQGECDTDVQKASSTCRASCHIQRFCANHTETVLCAKALRCEALMDREASCAAKAAKGQCESNPTQMLKNCLKACSETDLPGLMRFHLPHRRTTLSLHIDLPGSPPRMAGFYSTPPNARATELHAKALCGPAGFAAKARAARERRRQRAPWARHHWHQWELRPGRERTPRVPHRFDKVPAEEGSSRMVTVQHISYSPRIRYLHQLLTPAECEHIIRVAEPRFSRSPVRGSVTRVRTSSTAMLGGTNDAVVRRVRERIARFSGYNVHLIEPLQIVKYQQGQKYEGHHDFFDVCDLEDKEHNGRRQVTFLIYLKAMPPGETGGGTGFPDLKLEVAPEQGSAIVFNDCLDNGEEDQRTLHAGLPPAHSDTVKYAINGWIRSNRIQHMGAL